MEDLQFKFDKLYHKFNLACMHAADTPEYSDS